MNRIALSTLQLVAKPPWRGRYAAITRETPQRGLRDAMSWSCTYSLLMLARRSALARRIAERASS